MGVVAAFPCVEMKNVVRPISIRDQHDGETNADEDANLRFLRILIELTVVVGDKEWRLKTFPSNQMS